MLSYCTCGGPAKAVTMPMGGTFEVCTKCKLEKGTDPVERRVAESPYPPAPKVTYRPAAIDTRVGWCRMVKTDAMCWLVGSSVEYKHVMVSCRPQADAEHFEITVVIDNVNWHRTYFVLSGHSIATTKDLTALLYTNTFSAMKRLALSAGWQ